MTKGRGVLLFDDKEPKISGYLIIGNQHFEIEGQRVSDIRTNLHVRKISDSEQQQEDMFDDRSSQSGERKRDHP